MTTSRLQFQSLEQRLTKRGRLMSFRKTLIRIAGVGTLVGATLFGQERLHSQKNSTDVSELKDALAAQQKQLQQQQQEIADLKSMLQRQAANQASRTDPPPNTKIGGAQAPAPNLAAAPSTPSSPTASPVSGAGPIEPVVTTPEPTAVPEFDP